MINMKIKNESAYIRVFRKAPQVKYSGYTAGSRTNSRVSEVIFQFTRVKYKIIYYILLS